MTISGFVAYVKQFWKNNPDTSTPLSAARLTHMEDGIKGNSDAIAKIAAAVVSQIVNDPNKIASMAALYAVKQQVDQQNSDLDLKADADTIFYSEYNIDFTHSATARTWTYKSLTGIINTTDYILGITAKSSKRIDATAYAFFTTNMVGSSNVAGLEDNVTIRVLYSKKSLLVNS